MTPRERVRRAVAHEVPDRVPFDYTANAGIDARLKEHFRLAPDDAEGLLRALGVDFRTVTPRYIGPQLHSAANGVRTNLWGAHTRWVEHETGGYWDYCDWPLEDATVEEIDRFPLPSPDDFDYDAAMRRIDELDDYYLVVGDAGHADVINSTGMVRTMSTVLTDFALGEPSSLRYAERKSGVQLEVLARILERAQGRIDMVSMGEDLGTQIGPMISLDMYRSVLAPIHERFVRLGKRYDAAVMFHSCGSSSWVYPDLVEMGVDVMDTLQPEAKDMAPAYLKRTFGDRLAFHGCISTAGPLAYGSVADVRADVRETLEIMKLGGGYILAPTHAIQDNSPTGNVVEMYRAGREYGEY